MLLLTASPAFAAFAQGHGQDDSSLVIGAGLARLPTYEGSAENENRLAPLIAGHVRTRLGKIAVGSVGTGAGLAWSSVETDRFELGLSTGFTRDRDEDDGPLLRGMGDIDSTPEIGAFGIVKLGDLRLRLGGATAIGNKGHGGTYMDASLGYRFQWSPRLAVNADGVLTWANDDYMRSVFGVNAAQSLRSGLPAYEAGAGVKNVGVRIGLSYALDRHWGLQAGYTVSRLSGDAADSPIVAKRTQQRAFAGFSYRF